MMHGTVLKKSTLETIRNWQMDLKDDPILAGSSSYAVYMKPQEDRTAI